MTGSAEPGAIRVLVVGQDSTAGAAAIALTAAVLRPDGPLPGDRPPPPDRVLLAALDGADDVVGVASIAPAPWPLSDREAAAGVTWQLRGLAVAPLMRGHGIGAALLRQAVATAVTGGADCLWAAARTPALGLYVREGWRAVGPEWHKEGVGPHRYVWRPVP